MTFQEFKEKHQKTAVQEVSSSTPKNPVVSVMVQTYQQKDFIRECLDGILMQKTTFDFEILIGEDGSRDGTREICLEYANNFPGKIRLFLHHRENQIKVLGEATSNFNAFYNFYSARGNYIAFCEGDDFWEDPLKLQKQVDFLKFNTEFIFTYHRVDSVNENSQSIPGLEDYTQPELDIPSEDLLKGVYHPLLLSICFRNVLEEIPREMTQVINVDTFLLSLLGRYGKAKFLREIKPAKYRKHSGGIWSTRGKKMKYLSKIITFRELSRFYHRQEDVVLNEFYFNKLKSSYKMLINHYLKNGNLVSAAKSLVKLLMLRNKSQESRVKSQEPRKKRREK